MRITRILFFITFLIVFFAACNNSNQQEVKSNLNRSEQIKLQQYIVAGEILYQIHCSNCHKADGNGLKRLIPPLSNSDYFKQDSTKLICSMKYGLEGTITVNGVEYNQPMPANLKLTNLELAELSAFVYKNFLNQEKLILPGSVNQILSVCE